MKILSNFNKAIVVTLLSIALLNISSAQCMDPKKYMDFEDTQKALRKALDAREEVRRAVDEKSKLVFCGWNGFSIGSFAYSFITKNLKYARYSRTIGCLTAIPFVSVVAAMPVLAIADQCSSDSVKDSLKKTSLVVSQPYKWMVIKPAALHETLKIKKMHAKNNIEKNS